MHSAESQTNATPRASWLVPYPARGFPASSGDGPSQPPQDSPGRFPQSSWWPRSTSNRRHIDPATIAPREARPLRQPQPPRPVAPLHGRQRDPVRRTIRPDEVHPSRAEPPTDPTAQPRLALTPTPPHGTSPPDPSTTSPTPTDEPPPRRSAAETQSADQPPTTPTAPGQPRPPHGIRDHRRPERRDLLLAHHRDRLPPRRPRTRTSPAGGFKTQSLSAHPRFRGRIWPRPPDLPRTPLADLAQPYGLRARHTTHA